ncbi:hypothetical protein ACJX0J_035441 [Zea mays]
MNLLMLVPYDFLGLVETKHPYFFFIFYDFFEYDKNHLAQRHIKKSEEHDLFISLNSLFDGWMDGWIGDVAEDQTVGDGIEALASGNAILGLDFDDGIEGPICGNNGSQPIDTKFRANGDGIWDYGCIAWQTSLCPWKMLMDLAPLAMEKIEALGEVDGLMGLLDSGVVDEEEQVTLSLIKNLS